ncbi:hypothetical protein BG004_008017 [Podila humilis]|nr:hypothetical protein BG004_008017 [Podila humilis]
MEQRGSCTFSTIVTPLRTQKHLTIWPGIFFNRSIPSAARSQPSPPPRISTQSSSRFLSTSTFSIASDQETETVLSSSSLQSPRAPSTSPLKTASFLSLSNAEQETAPDFYRLFPNQQEPSKARTPWRKYDSAPGSTLEEALRSSVYRRDPIEVWWPIYEELSAGWSQAQSMSSVVETAFTRSDFIRFVTALKISQDPNRVQKLEKMFDDFHLAINTQQSNVRIYTTFMETLAFWKMRDAIPLWIQLIRSKIVLPDSTEILPTLPHVRESAQEQYHDLMRVLLKLNLTEMLQGCLQELKQSTSELLKPSKMAYDTMLEVYMRQQDTPQAMQLLEEMKDQGLTADMKTFNILLKGHLRNNDIFAAQRTLERLLLTSNKPDIYTFNALMSGYLDLNGYEHVNGFYKSLGEYGLVPNAKTYRIILKSYLKQGQVDQVVDLFCQLESSPNADLNPGPEEYRIVIQALANNGKMPEALKVLQEMMTKKIPVTAWIYNVFLTQYAKEGQLDKARRVMDKIIVDNLPLVVGSINALIQAYLKRDQMDQVAEMTDLMTLHGIQPSSTTYNIMINSTKKSGDFDGAMGYFDRMNAEGVAPDVWTYNTLLGVLVGKLSSNKKKATSKNEALVQGTDTNEYLSKIETLLHDMRTRGIKPNVISYGKLIHQYVISRDMEQAEMLFHEMVKSGISPNSHVFNMLMEGFAATEGMDKAVELFRRMPKYGVEPDATTFTTLVNGYARAKDLDQAQSFANSLQQRSSKISLDNHAFHTLMHLAQRSQQPGMALDFFEMMREHGLEADQYTFTILLNALGRELTSAGNAQKRRWNRTNRDGTTTTNDKSAWTTEAVESLLDLIRKQSAPLEHAQVTTIITSYIRLGQPQNALEFFKTIYWKGVPQLSTVNCSALMLGLLAPEQHRRYDGFVLNLYSKMVLCTKDLLQAKEDHKGLVGQAASVETNGPMTITSATKWDRDTASAPLDNWNVPSGPWAYLPSARPQTVSRSSRPRSGSLPASRYDLPPVDLTLISIMFQSFSQRKSWGLILKLWRDVETIGVENLHPFELPPQFLGWTAQAHFMLAKRHKRDLAFYADDGVDDTEAPISSAHESSTMEPDMADKLLRQLWNMHPWMGVEWSCRIYGFNIFESAGVVPHSSSPQSSDALAPSSSSSASSSPHPPAPAPAPATPTPSPLSPLLSPFLTGDSGHSNFGATSSSANAQLPNQKSSKL